MNSILSVKKICAGCGLCESVCPTNAIKMKNSSGYLRPTVDNVLCIDCGKCVSFCPNTDENREQADHNDFKTVIFGHSNSEKVRFEAASGGIVTTFCSYLLEEGIVDYVVTADEYYNDANGMFAICETGKELKEKSGSKYCPINMGGALRSIKKKNGTCVIVCLPCLARGVRKYIRSDKDLEKKIKYIIVLLCNHVPSYRATEYLLKKSKINKCDRVSYRGEGWSYTFKGFRKDDNLGYVETVRIKDYWGGSFSKMFWQNGCLLCEDHFGKYGDICVGDADFVKERPGEKNNIGETVCFIKNDTCMDILRDMQEKKIVYIDNRITEEELEKYYGESCEYNWVTKKNLKTCFFGARAEDFRREMRNGISIWIKLRFPLLHSCLKKVCHLK